jgi:hypothetical protein
MIANDAVSCVALGTGKALDNLDALDRWKREKRDRVSFYVKRNPVPVYAFLC